MDAIWIVVGCIFVVGVFTGVCVAALFVESHVRSEVERAYALGEIAGQRSAERLIPFPDRDPRRAA